MIGQFKKEGQKPNYKHFKIEAMYCLFPFTFFKTYVNYSIVIVLENRINERLYFHKNSYCIFIYLNLKGPPI